MAHLVSELNELEILIWSIINNVLNIETIVYILSFDGNRNVSWHQCENASVYCSKSASSVS